MEPNEAKEAALSPWPVRRWPRRAVLLSERKLKRFESSNVSSGRTSPASNSSTDVPLESPNVVFWASAAEASSRVGEPGGSGVGALTRNIGASKLGREPPRTEGGECEGGREPSLKSRLSAPSGVELPDDADGVLLDL